MHCLFALAWKPRTVTYQAAITLCLNNNKKGNVVIKLKMRRVRVTIVAVESNKYYYLQK
jgi:hypothetical protein